MNIRMNPISMSASNIFWNGTTWSIVKIFLSAWIATHKKAANTA